jgi:transposase
MVCQTAFRRKRNRPLEGLFPDHRQSRWLIKQIEEKKYDVSLIAKGVLRERIHKYGFAFRGKEVLIGEK